MLCHSEPFIGNRTVTKMYSAVLCNDRMIVLTDVH
jgi:hypothetical protein